MKLSIIIPCYNEDKYIEEIINSINSQPFSEKQIIVINDGSTDATKDKLESLKKFNKIDNLIHHEINKGKGAAIKSALKIVEGEIVIIQDADLEYSPSDYQNLVDPIIKGLTNVVYGSRFLNKKRFSFSDPINHNFRAGINLFFTFLSNMFNGQKLTDAHTGYKVFRREIITNIKLVDNGFSFCPEVTAKVSKMKEKILEVPISFSPRSYREGKKIKSIDGLRALKAIIFYNLL